MIIFNLDGCLADCEHRRHFVDNPFKGCDGNYRDCICKKCINRWNWKPDWSSFYEACDKDLPIQPVIKVLDHYIRGFLCNGNNDPNLNIEIWSGRCESTRIKTESWLRRYKLSGIPLKMRPIGNTEPDEVLKERWLDEAVSEGKTIEFVFDDRPKVVRMWRKRGVFVFNCLQVDHEF